MTLRNFFLSAVASSGIALGSEPSLGDGSGDALSHKDNQHIHVQASTGFEINHILDQGQFIDGNFAFIGIHAHADHWGAYYHWLQDQEGFLEHRAGIEYSHPISDSSKLTIAVSGTYEVAGSEHQDSHSVISHKTSSDNHKDLSHDQVSKHEPLLETTSYTAVSAGFDSTIFQDDNSKTDISLSAEYDFAGLSTLFVSAGIEHTQNLGPLVLRTGARIIDVLETDSTHLEEGVVGVGELGVRIPLGESKKWSLDFDGQMTTRGEKTAKFGLSRTF